MKALVKSLKDLEYKLLWTSMGDHKYLKRGTLSLLRILMWVRYRTGGISDGIITPKIISDKYKFIYITNPLVMSTSLRKAFLSRKEYDVRVEQIDLEERIEDFRDYFKFSFVRNPLTRVVSCYNKKIMNADTILKLRILSKHNTLNPEMTFEDFVNWLCTVEGNDQNANRHWISQHKLLFTSEGKRICDYIGKFENFKSDFSEICDYIGIEEPPLPRVATSGKLIKKPQKYYMYYNNDLVEKIYDRYRDDFIIFRYKKLDCNQKEDWI